MNRLKGHTNEETAYVVDDYPYGFKLRTKIRYWIDTTKNGQRFVSQTLNPKTDRWNKPKKSTYNDVVCLVLGENGHVSTIGTSIKWVDEDKVEAFFTSLGELDEYQANVLKLARAVAKTRKLVKVKMVNTTLWTDEQKQAHKEEQEKANKTLGKAFSVYAHGEGYNPNLDNKEATK